MRIQEALHELARQQDREGLRLAAAGQNVRAAEVELANLRDGVAREAEPSATLPAPDSYVSLWTHEHGSSFEDRIAHLQRLTERAEAAVARVDAA